MLIYGINPVLEALRAGRVTRLRVAGRADRRVTAILELAASSRVAVQHVPPIELDRVARGGVHQGVVADVRERESLTLDELIAGARQPPLVVILDQIEDPQNVGAILRTVDAAGADGVVRQTRHAAALRGGAAKAAAGALAHVQVAEVVNIA